MADYNRTIWKDHIKDQDGNVVQQGTPVSAQNLNKMEIKLVELSAKENTLAELIREEIPSGFTTLSDLDYSYMSTNPNSIKLSSDSVAFVNGYKVTIPAGTVITLDAPPTSGSRDDLVFLECWKKDDSNGSISWNYRIRVVDGVDFSKYSEGLGGYGNNTINPVTAQASNIAPIAPSTAWLPVFFNRNKALDGGTPGGQSQYVNDAGLYVAGSGDLTSKTTLGTTDGFCYAIPMFRVKRRNSGVYSVTNGNGGKSYYAITGNYTYTPILTGFSTQVTLNDVDYANVSVGDKFIASTAYAVQVTSKNGSNSVTLLNIGTTVVGSLNGGSYKLTSTARPDTLLANIIVERDIIDLRHQVSLTGFNYQQLLEENFDRLLRGELQTNAKTSMLKTYHGIAKTPIDANHVFYASFDGTTTAEVGGAPTEVYGSGNAFAPAPTGIGVVPTTRCREYSLSASLTDSITVDCYAPFNGILPNGNHIIYTLLDSSGTALLNFSFKNGDGSTLSITNGSGQGYWSIAPLGKHYRLVINSANIMIYVDGKLKYSVTRASASYFSSLNVSNITKIRVGSQYISSLQYISDFSISNIDRGAVFATLPQDFIDGYARIDKAFNTQRKALSDALTSETPTAQVKATGSNNKEITTTQATGGVWATNDTLKVKGLGGEIITGIIDADTALARVVSFTNNTYVLTVDDISRVVVGDTVSVYVSSFDFVLNASITAIDSTNKTITLGGLITSTPLSLYGGYVFETTASSSSPTVKTNVTGQAQAGASTTITLPTTFNPTDDVYNGLTITITGGTGAGQVRTISDYVGSTKVATVSSAWATNPDSTSIFTISGVTVAGTWSNLGTNEPTFTLGTLYALATQDLWVTYSLNEVAGQGGISEVLTATLAGESNGKKLTVNPSVHVRDDFAGKVSGSTTVNPNIVKSTTTQTILITPTGAWAEFGDAQYPRIQLLDNSMQVSSTTTVNTIPQHMFSFNLIRILEDKFGILPCPNDTASKVAWLKANIKSITCNWWGYGSCPSGNKATLFRYGMLTTTWGGSGVLSHTSSTTSIISLTDSNTVNIDSNGYIYYLAHTDASDGVTPSVINTDYVNLEIVLSTPTGYDVLSPENPRRDDGLSNLLLVRKETKEIQTLFPRSNTNGIVTYGDYVPYQGLGSSNITWNDSTLSIKSKNKNFISDVGTGKYNSKLLGVREDQLPTNINRSYYMNSNAIGYFKLEELNNLISNNNDLNNTLVSLLRNLAVDIFSSIFGNSSTKKLRGFTSSQGAVRNIDISNILTRFGLNINSYVTSGFIFSCQGNVYLVVLRTDVNSDKTIWIGGQSSLNTAIDIFYLPGRLLIK